MDAPLFDDALDPGAYVGGGFCGAEAPRSQPLYVGRLEVDESIVLKRGMAWMPNEQMDPGFHLREKLRQRIHPITHTTRAEALQFRLSGTLETQSRNPKKSAPKRANKIPEPMEMEPTCYSEPQIAFSPETHLGKTSPRLQAGRSQTRTNLLCGGASGEIPESVFASLVETAFFVRTNSKTVQGPSQIFFYAFFTVCSRRPILWLRPSILWLDSPIPHRTA
jgi:hypothetical protein